MHMRTEGLDCLRQSIILELDYLTDHAPKAGFQYVGFLRQEARDTVAIAPLTSSAAAFRLCAH
jgi:hypothetical protein